MYDTGTIDIGSKWYNSIQKLNSMYKHKHGLLSTEDWCEQSLWVRIYTNSFFQQQMLSVNLSRITLSADIFVYLIVFKSINAHRINIATLKICTITPIRTRP